MPDWLTHSLIGWITGKTLKQDVALVVFGALIPDLVKISLLFTWLGFNHHQFFEPLHTPIGALLVAGIISLFFRDIKTALLALSIGVSTHFILDFLLVHVHGGMKLLYPFSWGEWQWYLIRSDEYLITIASILAALLIYVVYKRYEKQKNLSRQQ